VNTYDPAHGVVYRHVSRETDDWAVPADLLEHHRPPAVPRQRQLPADAPERPRSGPPPAG
jgi:hypothetical protein